MSDQAGNQPADQQDQRVEDALDTDALASTDDTGQDEGLDDMVSRLLNELDDACDAAERSLAEDDAAEAASTSKPVAQTDEPQGEAEPKAEAVDEPEEVAAKPEPAPTSVADEQAGEEDPASAPDTDDSFADAETIDEVDDAADLDDAVAALTEELMGDGSAPAAEQPVPDEAPELDSDEPDAAEERAPAPEAASDIEEPAVATPEATAAEPASTPAAAGEADASADDALGGLGDLDDAIAALTSELIDGEFLDAAGESTEVDAGAETPAATAPIATPSATPPAPAESAPTAPAAPSTTAAPGPESVLSKAQTPERATAATPKAAKSPWKPKLVAAFAAIKALLTTLAVKAAPLGEKVARLMSAPLNSKPKAVRDLIGWAGLITVFYAACLWFVVLFLRSPQVPMAEGVPTGLVADTAQAASSTE